MRRPIIYLICLIAISCDKGLSPELSEPKVGFGGTITFSGKWNPEITQTHVVAFKDPLLSIADFNIFNLSFVSGTIPNGSQIYQYSTNGTNALISAIAPGEISYIAVAQSKKDTITLNREDWIVVGLYHTNKDSIVPGTITLPEALFVDSINIHCDFSNPPPQPPGEEDGLNIINSLIMRKNNPAIEK